jgi:hypothetical protein
MTSKYLSPNDIEAFFGYLVQLNKEEKGEVYTISRGLGNVTLKTLSTFNSLFVDKHVTSRLHNLL